MHHLEAWGDGWHHLPAIMMLIMFIAMTFCIMIVYRRRNQIFDGKWFRPERNRRWFTDCCSPVSYESPEDVLKRRYASGEISKEEFEEMKKNLTDDIQDK